LGYDVQNVATHIITSWFIAVRMLRFGRLSKNEHGV